ncbi:hypothetical protein [Gordoniibacillus kamchatkensis]|uniref:hypothetical protein n=1 Tax=Gordoniibacillus kamchatkensis TaxID=1590651 RepID=UPI0006965353|nr:hypothetical protein [Paenibacillus sp. VKM B-2647]
MLWVKEPSFNKSAAKRSSVIQDVKAATANRTLMSALLIVFVTSTSIMIMEPLLTVYVLKLGSYQNAAAIHAGVIFSAVGIATLFAAPGGANRHEDEL